ncbi:MAG TPA: asparagine synthase (glutamine-hydrolyzing) [Steroidobacteraceae bacterium]
MCGIAGMAALGGATVTQEQLRAMCDAMVYRGPDDAGYLVDPGVAIGMRRLAIIDLNSGHQPIFNEDDSVAVVFNGEIYNYRELRAWLEAHGHRFRTASDTEVIVHLWEEVGADFAQRLNGMFAIALLDRRQRKLVLARDHVGIKPLYYARVANGLVFGSEVKVLLASGWVPRRLDMDAVGQYLSWEYVPGAATMMRDVRRLEPASLLELDLQSAQIQIQRFWTPLRAGGSQGSAARSATDWEDEVDETVTRSVRQQLISDVPLGAFLSGGVDSSLVVAAMGAAQTFSIGFDDPTYNETQWSRRVADHLGVNHTIEIIRPDVHSLFDRLMHHMDDPIADVSIFPTYLVSKLAADHVKVVLSGDGGDELFGGYETFLAQEKARTWEMLPAWLRRGVIAPLAERVPPTAAKKGLVNKVKRFVEGASLPAPLGHTRWRLFLDERHRQALFTSSAAALLTSPVGAHIAQLNAEAAGLGARDRALYVDFRSYLVDNCLTKVDRMSMACSIEGRVPLLDKNLVELAFRVPEQLKYTSSETKVLLKRVAARHVPRECVYRPKQGFSIPIKNWLKVEFRDLLEHYLAPARIRASGIFQSAVVARLQREHFDNRANHSHVLWGLLVFEQWRDRWSVSL